MCLMKQLWTGVQQEINLFSYVLPKFKITKPIRLIELFAGIGSQAKALKKLGVKFEHYSGKCARSDI